MSNSETVIQPLHLCSISRSGEAVAEHNPAQKNRTYAPISQDGRHLLEKLSEAIYFLRPIC